MSLFHITGLSGKSKKRSSNDFFIDEYHIMVYNRHNMDYIMDDKKEMAALFRELSPENQSQLLACAELCHVAEKAVKKSIRNETGQISDTRGHDDE
jgi:hypothetical protein